MKIKLLLIFAFISESIFALSPLYSLKTKGNVTDMLYEEGQLYISEDIGCIQVFKIPSKKNSENYYLPKIKDFTGKYIPAKIYSFDKIKGKKILIAVSQGKHGFSNVFIFNEGERNIVIEDISAKLIIKKVKFLNEEKVIFGLLSNEIILYDIKKKKEIYRKQISPYTFSDIVLNKEKNKAVTADESGIIHIIDVLSGKISEELSGNNVDNVYQIDYKNNIILCGGQDRRLSVYNMTNNSSYYIKSDFLIYGTGLSPSGKYAAYSCNEDNDIQIINTITKTRINILKAHKSILTKILFISENEIFTGAEENIVYFWKI